MSPHRRTLPCLLLLLLACNPVQEPEPASLAASAQELAPIPQVTWKFADYPIPSSNYTVASTGTQPVIMARSDGMYVWDGAAWNPQPAEGWPATRGLSQMAGYGPGLLLFGGYDSNTGVYNAETWQWDGTRWTQLFPATTPPARIGQAMAVVGGKLVMFGGHSSQGPLTDTWTWDGQDWTQVPTTSSPSMRAYDMASLGDSALLLGGEAPNSLPPQTWRFDGTHWTRLYPATSPLDRSRWALAPLGGTVIAYDGTSTWRWSGTDWVQLSPPVSPATRSVGFLVAAGASVLHFGGSVNGSSARDTWTFDGTTWTERWKRPVSMKGASMARLGQKVVLFRATETWEWEGRGWTQRTPATVPPSRSFAAMATLGNKVVMYGGTNGDTRTWLWDGNNWTALTTAHNPGPRRNVGMAPLNGRLVLFGGLNMSQLAISDTWEFDGVDWKQLTTTNRPSARGGYGMAAAGGRVFLFGGAYTDGANPANTYYNGDFWSWDGTNWTYEPSGPGARYAPTMAELDGRVLLAAGRSSPSSNGVYLKDTWLYDPVTRTWSQPQTPRQASGLMESASTSLGHTVVMWGGGTDYAYGLGGTWTANASLPAATACSVSAQCETGWCVDGVCCQTACSGTCEACNLPGTEGSCTTVPAGAPRPGTCSSCDGNGGCDLPWDAGVPPVDAGSDAGTPDAGSDAGQPADAGTRDGGTGTGGGGTGGCATGMTGGSAWLMVFAASLGSLARRRRRAGSPPEGEG